ncbi:peptidylprolyl isomerase [Raineya sp.]|jgi:peptidyl-prolyl cis-trans isomerase D
MAVIGKIREKAGIIVGVIAIGLALFIVGDDFFRYFQKGKKGQEKVVGVFDGKEITLDDIALEIMEAERYYATNMPQQRPSEADLIRFAWSAYLRKNMLKPEYEALGLRVSDKEKKAMYEGDSIFIHPQVASAGIFQDSVTKKFDKKFVKEFLKNLKNNPDVKARWEMFLEGLVETRIQEKYSAMLSQSAYVTKAEAKREYENQNNKLALKYFYVPYTSIPDSAVKITDKELEDYLKKNKKRFKAPESRSFEYVIFTVAPSKEDTLEFSDELRKLAKDFALAQDDSAFAVNKTRGNEKNFKYRNPKEIPDGIYSENRPLLKGAVVGPFLHRNSFMMVKVSDIKEDSTYFVRSKHILFQVPKGADAKVKDSIRKEAEKLLARLKSGEIDFTKAAKQYGSDGTKDIGGDLGWYDEKTMVAPFSKATFGAKEKGLLPNLVETDFGFHIVSITEPKTNKKYKLAIIERPIYATQNTTEEVSLQAEEFLLGLKTYEDFKKKIEKDPKLVRKVAKKVAPYAQGVDGIPANAKPLISWAFNEAKVGEFPKKPIRIPEQGMFVVPILTARTEQDEPSLEYFRETLEYEVRNLKKREQIISKMNSYGNVSLDELAKKYASGFVVQEARDITMQNASISTAGYTPVGVGTAFGLQKGKRSKPIGDDNGVIVIEVTEQMPAPQIADYSQYKNNLLNTQKQNVSNFYYQALQELYRVKDFTYKFN